jgi:putative resolvase
VGVTYKSAWRWWRAGQLDAYQAASGTVMVREPQHDAAPGNRRVAVYARVSAAEHRPKLETQAERLVGYCAAKGYQAHQVQQVVKESGSGVNDSRPQFLKLLTDPTVVLIVVEHKERATRCGFRYRETLLEQQGRHIEVVNLADNLADNGRDDF